MSGQTAIKNKRGGKGPSALDIARLAGISASTVYMSLRDDPSISEDTRRRVRAVAEHLNYRPLAGARAIARGRTDSVGVVFSRPDMQTSSDWFGHYAPALEMISEELDRHDFAMSLVTWSDEKEELRLPRIFREIGVDGLLVLNTPETPVLERILDRHGKPYVSLDASAMPRRIAVAVDELRAAELAVEHLVQLGHRRIAYVPLPDEAGRPVEYIPLRQEMFPRGYARAMAAAGLAPIPGWDQPQIFDDFLQSLFNQPQPPTALLLYDDGVAVAAMQWLRDHHLAVPGDVSVVALQDNGSANQCARFGGGFPNITCKADMQKEMARLAVEKLLHRIDFPDKPVESAFLEPVLNVRESTGPCPFSS